MSLLLCVTSATPCFSEPSAAEAPSQFALLTKGGTVILKRNVYLHKDQDVHVAATNKFGVADQGTLAQILEVKPIPPKRLHRAAIQIALTNRLGQSHQGWVFYSPDFLSLEKTDRSVAQTEVVPTTSAPNLAKAKSPETPDPEIAKAPSSKSPAETLGGGFQVGDKVTLLKDLYFHENEDVRFDSDNKLGAVEKNSVAQITKIKLIPPKILQRMAIQLNLLKPQNQLQKGWVFFSPEFLSLKPGEGPGEDTPSAYSKMNTQENPERNQCSVNPATQVTASAEVFPPAFSSFSASPDFFYTKVYATDRNTGGKATYISNLNPGFNLKYHRIAPRRYTTTVYLGGRNENFLMPSGISSPNNSNRLFNLGVEVQWFALKEIPSFTLDSQFELRQESFFRATSTTTMNLDIIPVASLSVGPSVKIIDYAPLSISLNSKAILLFPSATSNYSISTGIGYFFGISTESVLSKQFLLSSTFWYGQKQQNSSIVNQTRNDLGVNLNLVFRFSNNEPSNSLSGVMQ